MSTKAGKKTAAEMRAEEIARIRTLAYGIKCLTASGAVAVIRAYAEEIEMHCNTLGQLEGKTDA